MTRIKVLRKNHAVSHSSMQNSKAGTESDHTGVLLAWAVLITSAFTMLGLSMPVHADIFIVTGGGGSNVTSNATFNYTSNFSSLIVPNPNYCDVGVFTRLYAYYRSNETLGAITNATMNFTITSPSVMWSEMDYNATTGAYEILFKSDTVGTVNFSVTANHTYFQNQSFSGFCRFRQPYYMNVYLWKDKNMTTPYINQFAWIYATNDKLKCGAGETHKCYFVGAYSYGYARLKLYEPETSSIDYDLYIIEGSLTQAEPYARPDISDKPETSVITSDFYLGKFAVSRFTSALNLYVPVTTSMFLTIWDSLIFIAKIFGGIIMFIAIFYITGDLLMAILVSGILTIGIMFI